jgi:type VI secretion system protein ImpC
LYHHVYVNEYGQYGGKPYGSIIGAYDFDRSQEDMNLLKRLAAVGAMAHAPFLGNVSSKFFGLDSFDNLQQIKDLESELENPKYRHWNSLRESDDSRNIGLCMPRFLLREPYNVENPVKSFQYTETTSGENKNYLWGHASFAFATRLLDSFAQYRWCPNIIGPQSGGTVDDLPVHMINENGLESMYGPTETVLSDRYEFVLSELGFIPLAVKKGTEKACFFSASSIQKPKYFGNDEESKIKEVNYKLGTQLPYLFVINRLAHYLKVLQRENLGSWKSRTEIENELNKWLRQYISDQENPSPAIRSQRPLRSAKITVEEDLDLGAGWYKINMAVTPHFKFMGANFTLFLSSKLDGE